MKTEFRHGDHVTLTDASGRTYAGALHLPDILMYGDSGNYWEPRIEGLGYALHTITREDGSRFRTDGRLS